VQQAMHFPFVHRVESSPHCPEKTSFPEQYNLSVSFPFSSTLLVSMNGHACPPEDGHTLLDPSGQVGRGGSGGGSFTLQQTTH